MLDDALNGHDEDWLDAHSQGDEYAENSLSYEDEFYNSLGVLFYLGCHGDLIHYGRWHDGKLIQELELPHLANIYNKLSKLEREADKIYSTSQYGDYEQTLYTDFKYSFKAMKEKIAETIRGKREQL